jgi:hypothetical protein
MQATTPSLLNASHEIQHVYDKTVDAIASNATASRFESSVEVGLVHHCLPPASGSFSTCGKNLHADYSSTVPAASNVTRTQARDTLAAICKDDAGSIAAVKDMMRLAVAGDSFCLTLELFFAALEIGLNLDIEFLCRDVLKLVQSTNQAEKLMLFYHSVIDMDQRLLKKSHYIPFRNLGGGNNLGKLM